MKYLSFTMIFCLFFISCSMLKDPSSFIFHIENIPFSKSYDDTLKILYKSFKKDDILTMTYEYYKGHERIYNDESSISVINQLLFGFNTIVTYNFINNKLSHVDFLIREESDEPLDRFLNYLYIKLQNSLIEYYGKPDKIINISTPGIITKLTINNQKDNIINHKYETKWKYKNYKISLYYEDNNGTLTDKIISDGCIHIKYE